MVRYAFRIISCTNQSKMCKNGIRVLYRIAANSCASIVSLTDSSHSSEVDPHPNMDQYRMLCHVEMKLSKTSEVSEDHAYMYNTWLGLEHLHVQYI